MANSTAPCGGSDPEAEAARILAEVRDLSQASGSILAAEFGPAPDYARQFGRRKRR